MESIASLCLGAILIVGLLIAWVVMRKLMGQARAIGTGVTAKGLKSKKQQQDLIRLSGIIGILG